MTYKRILTIQDISCLGQCSMTIALPILSACGHETCILPTAVLSTHTGGFGKPAVRQLADMIPEICRHWKSQNILFDAIYTGYLGSVEAVQQTEKIAEEFLSPDGILIVDPAMADHGRLYSGLDQTYAQAMKDLCRKADLILPNITEAAMFTGLPFEETVTKEYIDQLLLKLPHPCVVLTGVGFEEDQTGAAIVRNGICRNYFHKKFPQSFHGTGDLFASCLTGVLLRDIPLEEAVKIAADTVCLALQNTTENPAHWYGVKFETVIPDLLKMLER